MFTYAEAETLLAELHGVDRERQVGAFRARLKHLKKLGVPSGSTPGKGKKILYTREELYQWVFCLECYQFGIDPTWMASFVQKYWKNLYYHAFGRAEFHEQADDYFLVFTPSFMTSAWSDRVSDDPQTDVPFIGSVPKKEIQEHIDGMHGANRRMSILNVSDIARVVRARECALDSARGKTSKIEA
jgi:hypothetical protein